MSVHVFKDGLQLANTHTHENITVDVHQIYLVCVRNKAIRKGCYISYHPVVTFKETLLGLTVLLSLGINGGICDWPYAIISI